MQSEIKIHHLYHSGFSVETAHHFLVFDHYQNQPDPGASPTRENGVITNEDLKTEKDVFIFVTHGHGDHYHPQIFDWEQINPRIHYILSSDIVPPQQRENYHLMSPYESLSLGKIEIKTYGTTDQGLSYLVVVDGYTLYHAGDLNWWHWKSFSHAQLSQEETDYKREIDRITEKIDIAFSPVDPRLEEYYYLGAQYLAEKLQPKYLIPMHFGSQYHITKAFAERIASSAVKPVVIHGRGLISLENGSF